MRPYPRRLPRFEYGADIAVRRVNTVGQFAWHGQYVFLSSVLAGEEIGVEAVGDARWSISLGPLHLAYLDPAQQRLTPSVYWRYSPITLGSPSPIIPV